MQNTGCTASGTMAARTNSAPPPTSDRLVKRGKLFTLIRLLASSQLTVSDAPPRPAQRFTTHSTGEGTSTPRPRNRAAMGKSSTSAASVASADSLNGSNREFFARRCRDKYPSARPAKTNNWMPSRSDTGVSWMNSAKSQ